MKWWHCALLAAALTLAFGLPFHEYETHSLLPMKSVQAVRTKDGIRIVSEVGEGVGATWAQAVEDLRRKAAGEVFFDTAEQTLFSDRTLAKQAAKSGLLRPAAQVYFIDSAADPEGLNEYLKAHPSNLKISDLLLSF